MRKSLPSIPPEKPILIPAEEFVPPARCLRRVTGDHSFRVKTIGPREEQPFVIVADVCEYCQFIKPARPLRPEPAAFVREANRRACTDG